MSIGAFNKRHEITVQAYKESEPIRERGGIQRRIKTTPIDLRILFMHENAQEKRRQDGARYIQDSFTFQISSGEMIEKSFEIERGKTFITYNGNDYRVKLVKDYRSYRFTQAMQCTAFRIVDL